MSETASVADAEQERLARIVAEMDAAVLADVQRLLKGQHGDSAAKAAGKATEAGQPAAGGVDSHGEQTPVYGLPMARAEHRRTPCN